MAVRVKDWSSNVTQLSYWLGDLEQITSSSKLLVFSYLKNGDILEYLLMQLKTACTVSGPSQKT